VTTIEPDVHAAMARLPQVDVVLRAPGAAEVIAMFGRGRVTDTIRSVLDERRAQLRAGRGEPPAAEEVLEAVATRLEAIDQRAVTPVINATGVVVHTNLGRSPLSAAAREAVLRAAGYATVEYDRSSGTRGSRTAFAGELAAQLCGTEAATVVNNGAAALLLALAAVAGGREVVVSRGELIEIGGSFRLPDVMGLAGVTLIEVGTTNRTRPDDYRTAIGDATGLLLKAHRSNFRQIGFTREVTAAELASLATDTGLPFVYDLGSGLIVEADDGPLGVLADEPAVRRAVADGADLVVFSGDKLLGGPQAGIIAGRADLVAACARHPLARALRIDKLQQAALEATLAAHLRSELPLDVPTMAMLATDPAELVARGHALAAKLGQTATADEAASRVEFEVAEFAGVIGGGASPGTDVASAGLVLRCEAPERLAAQLRGGELPVIARIERDRVLLDLRTVPPEQDDLLAERLMAALA
jgi:L-seryl-tRNA(Ser) seleniumtransferase